MTLDRTNPPPLYDVVKQPGTDFIYEWLPVLFDGPVCSNEYDATQAAWRHRDAVRADLLRELAAELLVTKRGDLYDACIDRGTPNDVGFALKAMADALEGK